MFSPRFRKIRKDSSTQKGVGQATDLRKPRVYLEVRSAWLAGWEVTENGGDVRLRVRVGLDTRLNDVRPIEPTPKSMGTPSLIPPSFIDGVPAPSRLGRGKFDSGPAIPCRTSKLDRRCILVGVCGGGDIISGRSSGECGGEDMIPGGNGRGPRRMTFSRVCSWACCCLIECLSVDIWLRTATVRVVQHRGTHCYLLWGTHRDRPRRQTDCVRALSDSSCATKAVTKGGEEREATRAK